jgi:ferredoxin-like protein FixX
MQTDFQHLKQRNARWKSQLTGKHRVTCCPTDRSMAFNYDHQKEVLSTAKQCCHCTFNQIKRPKLTQIVFKYSVRTAQ